MLGPARDDEPQTARGGEMGAGPLLGGEVVDVVVLGTVVVVVVVEVVDVVVEVVDVVGGVAGLVVGGVLGLVIGGALGLVVGGAAVVVGVEADVVVGAEEVEVVVVPRLVVVAGEATSTQCLAARSTTVLETAELRDDDRGHAHAGVAA